MADFVDLTGRHSAITTFGAPILSANGTAFDGNSCIFVSDGLADFAFGVGSYTVELDVSVAAPASYIAGNLVDFIAGHFGWSIRQLWNAQNSYDPVWIEVIPSGGVNYQFGAGMNTWASIAISYDATAGVTRFFKTGILIATIAGQPALPLNAPRLTVGAEGRTFGSSSAVFPFIGSLRNLRITKAARYKASYTLGMFPYDASDPFWSATVLILAMQSAEPMPPIVVKPPVIDSIKLVQIDNGQFDLRFYDSDAGGAGPAVETLVYAVLFTDAEAPVARESDRYLRRGWWLDPQAGSGLWHVRRQPLGSAARREAIDMVRDVLEAHGLTSVDVQEATGVVGSVSGLLLTISGFYSGREFIVSVPL